MADVTYILNQIQSDDSAAADQLLPLVYDELRRLAAAKMASEKSGHTLQATGLVHEAFLRLVDVDQAQQWNSRRHFFAAAAEAMRRILVDAARRKQSDRRGGGREQFEILEGDAQTIPICDELLDLDEALLRLESVDARAAQVVQLRLFGGMTFDEIGAHLGISTSTAKRNWTFARAWLGRELASYVDESD